MAVHTNAGLFAGRTVLVTGGGSGVGRSAALAFAAAGANVVVAGRRAEPLTATVRRIRDLGGSALAVPADVTVEDDVRSLMARACEEYGRVNAAFNNAGVPGSGQDTDAFDDDLWDRVVNTNLKGVWLCMKHQLRHMTGAGGGVIVNMSSIAGLIGYFQAAPYTAAKHGVVGLTRVAAIEYATRGIRVNAVCAGPIDTPMLQEARRRRGPGADEFYRRNIPLGRLARPEEVAQAALWLASDQASYVTGTVLPVDGGWTAQ
ncbi:SDR family NAD(P)-dependent oxidoreductase [Catenuloplanes atrovinosus]|uniref:NAD(P)-dependent dehydrogenase (Short-subunit alcohol dehydrogenase family) n=1 Tax=Catenuloplanes atrovinosus TaxID=137266 RepID=A0AAE3YLA8_9ACTN|nr:glucose 1-dehydrogenase [Catenuloplanes atrovinosus]MDR7275585.1 NAD(P)-dependent dehydrogenase (short-subunit alcohol dehydrogenase family) [Catenuloplanes atrovinosus]